MYLLLYNISLLAFRAGIRVAALVNPKAKLWVKGRENIFKKLEDAISTRQKIIWMHCASLGEFEQGRPVAEKLKAGYPDHALLITFFSPSGYEVRKDYPLADYVFYLPMDSPKASARFLDIVKPALIIFVKYEFWYHYFKRISERQIPFLLVSAVFRNNQIFFKWYGGLFRQMLQRFTHLFVQDDASCNLVRSLNLQLSLTVAGDTRFDRVSEIAAAFEPVLPVENFCKGYRVIVAGSTWPEDEQALKESVSKETKLVIAPHEIGPAHIEQLKKLFPEAIFYSQLVNLAVTIPLPAPVLIIDTIGLLSRLYSYADITYVGGGFSRDGIHNILEAAVYSKPVLFGPVYQKYREASALIAAGGAQSFSNAAELQEIVSKLLTDTERCQKMSINAGNYVLDNTGATEKIMTFIQEKRLLTS